MARASRGPAALAQLRSPLRHRRRGCALPAGSDRQSRDGRLRGSGSAGKRRETQSPRPSKCVGGNISTRRGTSSRICPTSRAIAISCVRFIGSCRFLAPLMRSSSLQRTGRSGTYAPAYGQEAVPIGLASAMRETDVLVPSYREGSAQIWRGVKIGDLLQYFAGSERGQAWSAPSVRRDGRSASLSATRRCTQPIVAAALKYRGEDAAAVCVLATVRPPRAMCTRRSTSPAPGPFRWCSSSPTISGPYRRRAPAIGGRHARTEGSGRRYRCAADRRQRCAGSPRCGFGGARASARRRRRNIHRMHHLSSAGPQHGGRFDPLSRSRGSRAAPRACPLRRLRAFMQRNGMWSDEEEQVRNRSHKEIDGAVERHLGATAEGPQAMFDYLYELPLPMTGQRAEAVRPGHG